MPVFTSADSVARWPGPVILSASTGSLGSIAASTMRRPPPSTSETLVKAPAGKASAGQGTSSSMEALSSVPKRNDCLATTTVCVTGVFLFASRFLACILAWLLSQVWAMNTASRPKTTAKPIMTMVLARTGVGFPFDAKDEFFVWSSWGED